MKASVHDSSGKVVSHIILKDSCFGVPFNSALVHQALVRQLANARLGTATARTRSQVSGSTRKLYRQKHTGNARRGDIKSPLLRGGGVVFPPHARSYEQGLPKKMKRQALLGLLSAKVKDGEFLVVDEFKLEEVKTKEMARILKALNVEDTALLLTDGADPDVVRAARNLPGVKTLPVGLINVVDLLGYKQIVITKPAAKRIEKIWGEKAA